MVVSPPSDGMRPGSTPMICPYCGADEDKVIDSRSAEAGEAIRRRRVCGHCGKRFTTFERVEKARRLAVIKRDGTREPFDPQRILAGVQAACGKRPVDEAVKLGLVDQIADSVHRDFDSEVPSREIGGRVARGLRDVDPIVYIRFASEYYAYQSLEEMNEEIKRLDGYVPAGRDQGSLFEGGRGSGGPGEGTTGSTARTRATKPKSTKS
jgi:transcriptional repressor NrdR